MKRGLRLGVLLLFVAVAAGSTYLARAFTEPIIASGAVQEILIEKGSSFQEVSDKLVTLGVTDSHAYNWLAAKLLRAEGRIKAGEYQLVGPLGMFDILMTLTEGRGVFHSVTLFEGWTIIEMLNAMQRNPMLQSSENPLELFGFKSPREAEGHCLPDTYKHLRGDTDVQILALCIQAMEDLLQELWANRAQGLPYKTPEEAVIMASIIEAETSQDDERAIIAGVLLSRLEKGMRLQVDPSVIYGLGPDFDNNLTRKHLRQSAEINPYNTYRIYGLPPGAIGNPGRKSLEAALHPDFSGDALYYVSKGDGRHHFSKTYEEHRASVRKYQLKK